jgi:hypothetical protein
MAQELCQRRQFCRSIVNNLSLRQQGTSSSFCVSFCAHRAQKETQKEDEVPL